MTGSAFSRWTLHSVPEAILFTDKGRSSRRGKRSRFWLTERLADDGKRLCDLIAARNVVIRLAPQDNLHQY